MVALSGVLCGSGERVKSSSSWDVEKRDQDERGVAGRGPREKGLVT